MDNKVTLTVEFEGKEVLITILEKIEFLSTELESIRKSIYGMLLKH